MTGKSINSWTGAKSCDKVSFSDKKSEVTGGYWYNYHRQQTDQSKNNSSSGRTGVAKNRRPFDQVSSSIVRIEEQGVEGLFTVFSSLSSSQSWKS